MAKKKLTEIVGLPIREIKEEFVSVAELQRRIMPDPERLTFFANYDIFGKTLPISIVGGDFYDFIDLDRRFGIRDKMGIVIADASGHGLVAAMLIRDFNTALYTAISFQAHYVQDTTPLLFTKINRRMYRSSQENQYIAAFYGELRLDGVIHYINAGHLSPLLFKKNQIVPLNTGGPVLGAFRDLPSESQVGTAQMDTRDVLVCYTDGIIESVGPRSRQYGLDRLKKVVKANLHRQSQKIFDAIIGDVNRFSGPEGQTDDRTVIVIKRLPATQKRNMGDD